MICKGAMYFTGFVNTDLGLFLFSFFLIKIQHILVFAIYYS